ncbi:MAG: hypothetical protein M1826_005025 [Phylliscum demangeonii]|nr:MAG: hypothetical protein M1826_005025 [Phylliscum demangeonii]
METLKELEWSPMSDLEAGGQDFALLILNRPISDDSLFRRLWTHANYKICADGAANRLYTFFGNRTSLDKDTLPDEICGDLDSVKPAVRRVYEEYGVAITYRPSQYATDFAKCLQQLHARSSRRVLVFGGMSGRMDQVFSQIHQLHVFAQDYPGIAVFLYTEKNVSFLLEPGLNAIHAPLSAGYFRENVGILPVGRPAVISTTGLEWDVSDWHTAFGTQVTTSNHLKNDTVTVETTERVLFTVELARPMLACPCHGCNQVIQSPAEMIP